MYIKNTTSQTDTYSKANLNIGAQISHGQSAEIFLWEDAHVLKLYYPWVPIPFFDQEYANCLQVWGQGVPCPKLHKTISIDDRQGLVFDRVMGRSLDSLIRMKPWQVIKMGKKMAHLHAQIHGFHSTELPFQNDVLKERFNAVRTFLGAEIDKVIDYLGTLPIHHCVCHGDFHPNNILCSVYGWKAIDWVEAYSGNPLSDVARTYIILKAPHSEPDIPIGLGKIVQYIKNTLCRAYLKKYFTLSQYQFEDLEPWLLPMAVVRLRENIAGESQWLLNMIDDKIKKNKGFR